MIRQLLLLPLLAGALLLSACAPLLGMMAGGLGTPPQAPAAVTTISRTAIDFALHSFDAALYGLDFAMDSGRLKPGSPTAKQIAAAGRKVMGALGVADAAQKLGSSATYEEAFKNANDALQEFRGLLPAPAALADRPPLTDAERMAIIRRLERDTATIA